MLTFANMTNRFCPRGFEVLVEGNGRHYFMMMREET